MANSNVRQIPPIYHGTTILVQGTILPNANRFAINLCAGCDFGVCDTALHVNPRYDQNNVVVRNAFVNGAWSEEERSGAPFNVPRGGNIETLILVENDVIKVAFNGQHYCEFRHRIPKERVTYIVASGDIQVTNITFYGPGLSMGFYGGPAVGATTMPYQLPHQPPGGFYAPPNVGFPVPSGYVAPGSGYDKPHPAMAPGKYYIPGGLFPGRLIYIKLTPGSTKFDVNLKHNESGNDIAFHFNPRLQDKVVVRNSCLGGNWGNEERQQPCFPFVAGQPSQLIILCEQNQLKVAVNNSHFIEFQLRDPNLAAIQWIEVVNDVKDVSINVQ